MWVFPGYPLSLILTAALIASVLYFVPYFSSVRLSILKLTIINFVIIYLLIVGSVVFYELYLDYKIRTFDLNGDSFFSEVEINSEYAKYSSLLTNDIGRKFAPITGLFFSLVCSAIFYGILKIANYARKASKGERRP